MSFIEGFLQLPQGLEAAYKKAAEDGQGGVLPADIISELAENLGDSIHDYMKTAMESSVDDLKDEIRIALEKQGDEGKVTGCDPIEILENLAERLAEAIHKFALTSVVETEVTLAGGVTLVGYVTPAGAPLPAASLPTTPGLAVGLGDPAQVSGTGLS